MLELPSKQHFKKKKRKSNLNTEEPCVYKDGNMINYVAYGQRYYNYNIK